METKEFEFRGLQINGFLAIVIAIIAALAIGYLLIISDNFILSPLGGALVLIIVWALAKGLMMVEPNETRVLIFFGRYSGTFKKNGFYWVNPFLSKDRVPVRARNLEIEPIKVNDKAGNPIMIGAVMIWRIKDTYKARFDIESTYGNVIASSEYFVHVQSDAALREVAGKYAYDNNTATEVDEITLRSDNGEINDRLEEELNNRLSIAGIEVMEARINYLAYASEIASVMLRRQQADAVIAAREKIVEGAVSMVHMALDQIDKEGKVKMSDEKKADMVGNLLVVLCSDESAQPVLNTGSGK